MTLSLARLKELLEYEPETGVFRWKVNRASNARAGDMAGAVAKNGYRLITIDNRQYYAHRLAWFYETGFWPTNNIDHANRSTDDNRFANLRAATQSQNMANQKSRPNSTGFRGVYFHKQRNRFAVQIAFGGSRRSLGLFDTPEAAHAAYCAAANELHGKFARTA